MHTPIVSVINGEPLASTEVIARGFKVLGRDGEGRQHKLDVVSRKDLLAGHLFLLG